MGDYIIEMTNISKTFGSVRANHDVSVHIKKGEIRALLGENGAGKSTLMKMLYGLYAPDSGSITIDGVPMPPHYAPEDAIARGVAMVSQHFMLVDAFTVAENIILGKEQELHKFRFSKKEAEQRIQELCDRYHIHLSPKSNVGMLSLGEKQKTEILKALYRDSKVLILDEPTAVLTPQETQELFAMLEDLRRNGMTIILIAHKLEEVMQICDRITILRQGEKVCTMNREETNIHDLAVRMIGKELPQITVQEKAVSPEEQPVLSLRNITTAPKGERCCLKGFDLDLYAGRIVGIAGIDGNGQTDILEVLAGFRKITSGSISNGELELTANSIKGIHPFSIGIIPEDRHQQGLVMDFSVQNNLLMRRRHDPQFVNHGVLRKAKVQQYAGELIEEYDIRPRNKELEVRVLSGGNQQKVVIARELGNPDLKIVVAAQPTRGLDVGAIAFVHKTLLELRQEGKAVLLISSDLDEIRALSDYIAVLHDGRIKLNRLSSQLTVGEIGLAMGGADVEEVSE